MHPLLRFALYAAPPEFRRRFGTQIALDGQEYRGAEVLGACTNVIASGLYMRGENLLRDLGFALRSLSKAPSYTAVAILAFALAIGANVAVASVLDAVLIKPLPFPAPEHLVEISQGTSLEGQISYANARDIQQRTRTLSGIALSRENASTLTNYGKPEILHGWVVNAAYFEVLGVQAQLGRLLGARDLGTHNVVISDTTWHRYFNGDAGVLGKILRLDDVDYTVVGVAPRDLRNPVPGALADRGYWSAVDPHSILAGSRVWTGFHGLARLAPGVTVSAARADLTRVLSDLAKKYPRDFVGATGATMVPLLEAIVGSTRTLLWLLYVAVGMVLLIACVNIANLTMARIAAREGELVVRTALGAARRRIVAQLMTELAVLAIAGGALGVAIAYGILAALRNVFSTLLPRWEDVSLNGHVLFYAILLVAAALAVTGLLPAFANREDMTLALKSAGRSGDRTGGRVLRKSLVVAEVALAVAVVVSAGLVLRSFVALTHTQLGFAPRNLWEVTVTLPYDKYYSDPKAAYEVSSAVTAFSHRVVKGLRAMPGVTDAAAAIIVPFGFNTYPRAFTIPGRPDPHATVTTNAISAHFFHTMEIPLLRGRDFNARDASSTASTAIVSAGFARHYFGTIDVVGRQIALTPFTPTKPVPQTIVGVAGDTRSSLARVPEPQIYIPQEQIPLALFYVVRTTGDISIAAPVTAEFASIDPAVAPPHVESFGTLLARDAVRSQAATILFGILALLALILSLAGIYAVTAYSVEQRTREFGIRQAIGARAGDVMNDVLRGALTQTGIGIAAGLALAAIFTRLLSGLLFEISPLDPLTYAGVMVVMVLAVVAAAAVPAVRAARVQPATAIRYE